MNKEKRKFRKLKEDMNRYSSYLTINHNEGT